MSPCPGDHTLHLFVRGDLGSVDQAGVKGHVAGCAHCQDVLVALGQADAPKPTSGPLPTQVDEFRLVRMLGKGGMGEVYLARDTKLERDVALKFLVTPGDEGSERLLREARAVARVQHPNVVAVYGVGEVNGRPYLVSELVEGTTLAGVPQPVATAEARRLGVQIARGLAAAHAQSVLHRDLKPANVMVAKDGTAKLLDFGLAKAVVDPAQAIDSATDLRLTQTGALVGTPRFLAPEIWAGQPASVQSDLWAFGVTLYQLLTGTQPFVATDLISLRAKVLGGPPAPMEGKAPADAAALCAVVARCLAREPEARFASADALVAALEAAVPGTGKRARRWPAVAAGVAALLAASAWGWSGTLPLGERTVALTCTGDEGLAAAACARARQAWCRGGHTYRCAGAAANVAAELQVRADGEGVALVLSAGRLAGRRSEVARLHAASVAEGLTALGPLLDRHVGAGRAPLPPSDAERAAARALGTESIEAYRKWQEAMEVHLGVVNVDESRADEVLDAVLALDPGWAHPYVMRLVHHKMTGPVAEATMAAARARVRDTTMLDALDLIVAEKMSDAAALLEPHVKARPGDALLGYVHALCLYFARLPDQSIASVRRLAEAFPELQFGGDLASQLFQTGRAAELDGFAAEWRKRDPGNEQALLLEMGLAVSRDQPDRVRALGADYLRIHGHSPHRWVKLCEALISVGLLRDAHVWADRLVAAGGEERAKGLQQVGILDVLEGRFLAAEQVLAAAIDAKGEERSRPIQAMQALASVQRLLGEKEKARATQERLIQAAAKARTPDLLAVVQYEAQLEAGGCPAFEALLPTGPSRADALVPLKRARANAGCGGCAEVVRAGFAPAERSVVSLLHFGLCAVEEKQWRAAEDAFTRAVLLAPNLNHGMMRFSPVHSVLAKFHLARVLEQQGRVAEARARYAQFLAGWSGAAAQVPEVGQAQAALARLQQQR